MEHRNVIFIALTMLCTWAGPGTCQSFTSGLSVSAVEEWDHFIFSMHWPQSICVERNETGIFNCSIPRETTSWIIHGLWPTNNTSEKPVCCKGASFNRSLLDPIKDQLDVHWPNLFIGQTAGEFWKHEWKKHGTCAASMESLSTQLEYFNVTLSILERFNIASGLAKFNIVPSDNTFYTVSDFQRAFNSLYNVSSKMLCFPSSRKSKNGPKRSAYQYISEIEFCMDKQFHNIECPRKIHPNSRPRPFCLHPLHHHNQHPLLPHRRHLHHHQNLEPKQYRSRRQESSEAVVSSKKKQSALDELRSLKLKFSWVASLLAESSSSSSSFSSPSDPPSSSSNRLLFAKKLLPSDDLGGNFRSSGFNIRRQLVTKMSQPTNSNDNDDDINSINNVNDFINNLKKDLKNVDANFRKNIFDEIQVNNNNNGADDREEKVQETVDDVVGDDDDDDDDEANDEADDDHHFYDDGDDGDEFLLDGDMLGGVNPCLDSKKIHYPIIRY